MSQPKIEVTPKIELSEQDAKDISNYFQEIGKIMLRAGVTNVEMPNHTGIKASARVGDLD